MVALVLGASGFIGSHMCSRLKKEGYIVHGVDKKKYEYGDLDVDYFIHDDLTDNHFVRWLMARPYNEIYQFAADMGGAGYVFTGENDFNIIKNSMTINLNVARNYKAGKLFFSSSACVYPDYNQKLPNKPYTEESSAYPANPDSNYGWEKLFAEWLYQSMRQRDIKIGRFHNIYGPKGTYAGGREKAPAAMCRKVIEAKDGGSIEIWGSGTQTRSFLYIDDCINAVREFMSNDFFSGPVNIGSQEMVTINELAKMAIAISGKNIEIKHVDGPIGVNGRTSHNVLAYKMLEWRPEITLYDGMGRTYRWIEDRIRK